MEARPTTGRRRRGARALAVLAILALGACAARGVAEGPPPGPVERSGAIGTVWDVSAGEPVAPEVLASRLAKADVAILGEIHDNPTQHARQAWLVRAIRPKGLAFEMVPQASEEGIAVFRAQGGAPGEIGPAIGWDRLGWPDWALYGPIFEAAPKAYVAGGGVARHELIQAMRKGAAAVYGPKAKAAGLDRPLPPAMERQAEAEMVSSHCGMLPASQAAPMVEAQRLRDARFAAATLRAIRKGGKPAVLITGDGHARADRGVPVYLEALSPRLDVVSVGQVEVPPGTDPVTAAEGEPYDYVWFSEAVADRPDPCLAFSKG